MPRKYANAETHTFSLDRDVFNMARRVAMYKYGKSLNELINEFLQRLVKEGEMEGSAEVKYESVKSSYVRAVLEVKRLTDLLRKAGVYDDLKALVYDLGLDFKTLRNVKEIIAKLMREWDGKPEHLHMFIDLLEAAEKKKRFERELTQLRRQLYFSNEGSTVGEADATAHAVSNADGLSKMRANGA